MESIILQDSARVMSAARRKNPKTGSTKNTENKPRKLIIIITITIIIIIIINFLLCALAEGHINPWPTGPLEFTSLLKSMLFLVA